MSHVVSGLSSAVVKHRQHQRAVAESVLRLSSHLAKTDRLLIEQVYARGTSVADVSRLTGRPSKLVRRKLSQLMRRMNSPLFRYVVAHQSLIPGPTRRVADLVVLQGQSLRKAAASAGVTLHRVRLQMQRLRAMADSAGRSHSGVSGASGASGASGVAGAA